MSGHTQTIERLTVIGVGLIGGSLARALRRAHACGHIIGCGRNVANLERAVELGVIDSFSLDPGTAVENADMVVFATPLSAYADLFAAVSGKLSATATITDAGSVKGSVVQCARTSLSPAEYARFVPGHPIAGTEQSGVEASFETLFDNRLVILTPDNNVEPSHVQRVTDMWRSAGAGVVNMGIDHHDNILAATSHLPHLLAYALVDCLAGMQDSGEIFKYAAGGFADFTRIASSSPRMWADICFANREQVLDRLGDFDAYLLDIRSAIEANDVAALLEIFSRAKQARDTFLDLKKQH